MRNARWVWLAAGGLLVLGCVALVLWFLRESEPTVTGTVRLDNELLPTGSIAWIPIEGTPGPGGGGGINNEGKYEIKRGLRPGKYRVEIRSTTHDYETGQEPHHPVGTRRRGGVGDTRAIQHQE